MLGLDPTTGKLKVNGVSKPVEDPRNIPTQPLIYSKPAELQTPTSLLKNLEDDLKGVDYSAYQMIAELDKEVSMPKPPASSMSMPKPPASSMSMPKPPASSMSMPKPPASSMSPPAPIPNPYNVKNSAPFYNEQEKYFYENIKPEYKSIYNSISQEDKSDFKNTVLSEQMATFKSRDMNAIFEFYKNALVGKWKRNTLPPINYS